MGSCAWLATTLDHEMLLKRIFSPLYAVTELEVRRGQDVADELGGRFLLRYVTPELVHEAAGERQGVVTFVTPTAYAPGELKHWLDLPMPDIPRTYVIRLDPSQIDAIAGPQWVGAGMGIQYVLPEGYGPEAVVGPGWAHEVR